MAGKTTTERKDAELSALSKWLAKYAHQLTEAEQISIRELGAAKSADVTAMNTSSGLKRMAPKETKDINWLYDPEHDRNYQRLVKAANDYAGESGTPMTRELNDALFNDNVSAWPSNDMLTKYRKKEKF